MQLISHSWKVQFCHSKFSLWPYPIAGQQSHISALKFLKINTLSSSIQNSCHHEKSSSDSHGICDKMDAGDHLVKSSNEGIISSVFDTPNPENSRCSSKFSIYSEITGDLRIRILKDGSVASCKIDSKIDGVEATGCSGSSMEGFPKLTNEPGPHSAGDVPESNRRLGSEFLEHSNEFHSKPTYHHDYSAWTDCHFNPHKLQQCQMNAFESHFYPYPTEVDGGVTLSEALLRHDKWLDKKGIKNANFAVVTWSSWDCRVMLEPECRFKKIRKPPYFNRWINLRIPFSEVFGDVKCNLKEVVKIAGLAWQGRPHYGLDDAKNTARLLALLMHRGFKFSITNSILWQMADRSLLWKQSQEQQSAYPHCPYKARDGHVQKAVEKEFEMALQDRVMEDTKDKKNAAQAYVYDMRNKLNDKYLEFVQASESGEFLAKNSRRRRIGYMRMVKMKPKLLQKRALIVSAELDLLAGTSTNFDKGLHSFRSLLWVGHALLFSTTTVISTLGWDGKVRPILSVSMPHAVLIGALNDRLLLASLTEINPRHKKGVEIKSCLVGLLEPILIGFATMQRSFEQKLDLSEMLYQLMASSETSDVCLMSHQKSSSTLGACSDHPSKQTHGVSYAGSYTSLSMFNRIHPQFIGFTCGKLHELVMKSYKSRELAAAINEVIDPWINARQPKKDIEKQIYWKSGGDTRAAKRARMLVDDSEEDSWSLRSKQAFGKWRLL
ncbi:hypothetical protein KIW84_044868 [Lathyrus oleraceus]|uniref:Exonuclease domain-containing protein n=1 Tax=Pisum sativum TaxID=3888 RepID=A0A9D4XLN8_PEA|nr:hypothetical protein KIW84_044868 [Pisum sativum]